MITRTTEKFSPGKAQEILNKLNSDNRKLREGVAEVYANDMRDGRWTFCTAPVVFYDDGELADGQHRLWAVVLSGKTVTFDVIRGLPRPAGLNIDTGLPRTLVDNCRISGTDTGLSNQLLSVVRAIEDGECSSGRNKRSNAERLDILAKHRAAGEWVLANAPRGRFLHNAVTMGAMGRAWYWEKDKARLARYSEVLSSGFADGDGDSAAIAMRNYLISKGASAAMSREWRDSFLKCQNSIDYFMRGRKLHIIKGVTNETYPLRDGRTSRKVA